ncbi:MAG: DUF357 domain-containing protein [Candidatus Hadarchaeum sp.]|uniref:DUF357 domain-containing protein n=1 Tax=Candidatus Hadarchaeum sp. TaxID=2883567 RepID=UPI003D0C89D2
MKLEDELRAEIEKWTRRLDESLAGVQPSGEHGARMLENIRAYRADSGHFYQRGDLIRSFECLVWAWAILEVGKELGHLTGP